jgi:hypothetical protein
MAYLWASVDDRSKLEQRVFRTATTGEIFNGERLKYIGHVQLGGETNKEAWFEWFIYEIDLTLSQLVPDLVEDRFLADMKQAHEEAAKEATSDDSDLAKALADAALAEAI